jgi:hypothetical protein
VDGGDVIGETELMPEALPERFEEDTRLRLGEHSWEVLRAEPPRRADWIRAGAVTLTLRRVDTPAPKPQDVLYSLPTICDALPATCGAPAAGQQLLTLHEDSWRQVELVSRIHTAAVHAELAAIERILQARSGPGFRDLHVRRQPTSPLVECHLTAAILERALPGAGPLDGVGFGSPPEVIEGGFAYAAGDMRVYGVSVDGVAMCLGLSRVAATVPPALKGLIADHGLMLVDWCAARVVA